MASTTRMGRGNLLVFVAAVAQAVLVQMAFVPVVMAQPKSELPPLLGAHPVLVATATSGFIDDVVSGEGERVAYVVSDGTTKAALHLATAGSKDERIVDISAVTLQPTALHLVGERLFVVGLENGKHVAGLIELTDRDKRRRAGTVVYKLGPADHITLIARDGKQRVAVHRQTEMPGEATRHNVELVALETGRRLRAGKPLTLDSSNQDKKLELRVNHWSDGWTRAHGIKAGTWDRKEDQRAPDSEATLDLVTGKLTTAPIGDLFEQKRRFAALADAGGELDFVRLAPDGSAIQLWHKGKNRVVELDQPLANYDPKSLQGVVNGDGSGWLAFKVDPVNPAAVARKKADPEYLDIFRFGADGKATRRARVFAKGARYRFGVIGERFWLIERNAGFERGGKSITLYQLQ